jgi:uncharacterized protein with NRDE domain
MKMCLILFSYNIHAQYKLILAANRDEFYQRPTLPAQFWNNYPNLLAGKDLKGDGTWMGITRHGRFSAITNFREPENASKNAPTRGFLVRNFLEDDSNPENYLKMIKEDTQHYNGFNLIVGTREGIYYYSNRQNKILEIRPGVHGLSNHLLNTDWPKVKKGKQLLNGMMLQYNLDVENLFSILQDRSNPPDHLLPNTGVSLEWERILSSIFIISHTYGTRSSTILLWDRKGNIDFFERTFIPGKECIMKNETRHFSFTISKHQGSPR